MIKNMICNCSMAGTKACLNCSNSVNVDSNIYGWDILNKYTKFDIEKDKKEKLNEDIENRR